ncbi:MAG TPA: phosphate acetyltransferase [Clostridiales bacterium]|nr:phosphate acetyltransferase [Clostridiales bacterium]
MLLMEPVIAKAKQNPRHIVLPEGTEERTIRAAAAAVQQGIARTTLIGKEQKIRAAADELGVDLEGVGIIDPELSPDFPSLAGRYFEMRKSKGISPDEAARIMKNELYFATMLVKAGLADGMVAGAVTATSDVLRPGLQIIKMAENVSVVSCCFIENVINKTYGDDGRLIFADTSLNPNPTAEQLAAIAIASAATAKDLFGMEPRVAMLSFSTKGSGKHEFVDKVVRATELVRQMAPNLVVDGELQADAALVESVGRRKCPDSPVAGKANVLVFPDLQSANIGQKLVQWLGEAETVGPISQGFALPINDLPRGCNAGDIVNIIAITAVQALKESHQAEK